MIPLLLALLVPETARAAATLAITGRRGGSTTIDLGELDASQYTTFEELTINVNPGTASQYRLTQAVMKPLTNERGTAIDPRRIIMELHGGTTGTRRFQGTTPMTSVTELYVSNRTGTPEQLTLILSVSAAESFESGTYSGLLTYTVQVVNGTSVKNVTLPIRLRVQPVVSLLLADNSPRRVTFEDAKPGDTINAKPIRLLVRSNVRGALQLQQSMDAPPRNDAGQEIPWATFQVVGALSNGGSIPAQPLAPTLQLLPTGIHPEEVQWIDLGYTANIPPDQRAGSYRSVLEFAFSGVGNPNLGRLKLPFEVIVPEVMSIEVLGETTAEQPQFLFPRVMPGEPTPIQSLRVQVQVNGGQPYVVFQQLSRPLVSKEGNRLPEESLICGAGATLDNSRLPSSMAPVSLERQSVYRSNVKGTSIQFYVSCRMRVPSTSLAGTYQSSLIYTVTPF